MVSFFNNFIPRSDFAIDLIGDKKQGYKMSKKIKKDIEVTKIEVLEDQNTLNKKKGSYYSIRYDSFADKNEREDIIEVLSYELKSLLKKINLKKEDVILIAGLGNKQVTADALGPLSSSKVCVTNHLYEFDKELLPKGSSRVCVVAPGVMGQTGLETSDILKSINKFIKAKVIIVIDALATYSLSRINKMIQLTDTGIEPGSGVGNKRKAINKEEFGVDIIAIGVATVVDTLNVIHQVLSNLDVDYDSRKLDFLNNNEYQLVVTPKEIDEEIHLLSDIISESINRALHEDFSLF